MENTVNILDLLVQELNRTQSLKSSIESKAVGYLTPVTLILNIVVMFLTEVYKRKDICQTEWHGLILISAVLFALGVVLFISFARVLMPSEMNYFSAEGLINLYSEEMSETDRTVTVLNDVTNAVEKNTKKIIKLNRYNRVISFGVFALVFGFAIASVLFFFSL